MTPTFKEYRVQALKPNPNNPRGNRYDEHELRALAKSLRQRQWMPIVVQEPLAVVLDGNRRVAAAELDGIETLFGIPVTNELTPKEINRMIAQLDLRHQSFSEIARGKLWLSIREENSWNNAQLAEELGVSAGLLTLVFGTVANPDEIQQMVEDDVCTLRDGYHLSRIEDVNERLRIARELAAGRVTHHGLALMVRKPKQSKNGHQPERRVNRIACPLASGVTVTISGEGLSLDDGINALAEVLKLAKKACDEGHDGKSFEKFMKTKTKVQAEGERLPAGIEGRP
jgi:ParB family chromosome partitioning protein